MEIEFPVLIFLLRQSVFRLRSLIMASQYMRSNSMSITAMIASKRQLRDSGKH